MEWCWWHINSQGMRAGPGALLHQELNQVCADSSSVLLCWRIYTFCLVCSSDQAAVVIG
jgi:hypothetical protein